MKTKAIILKVVAVMVLVAMVNVAAVSQKNNNGKYHEYITYTHPVYSQPVVVESSPVVRDWMLDDMAFLFQSEDPQIEDWMVLLDTEKEWYMADEYYSTDWLLVDENQFEVDLFDWMIEDFSAMDMEFSDSFEDVEMQEWMLDNVPTVVEAEDDSVTLQNWMIDGFEGTHDVILHDWMLNQASWN